MARTRPILGFDTATADTAVAVTIAGELARRAPRRAPSPAGGRATPRCCMDEIEACVAEAGGWERIERIAVGVGPGHVHRPAGRDRDGAGARPGPRAADRRGRLAGGAGPRDRRAGARTAPRLALIDARRGEVFAALFDAVRRGSSGSRRRSIPRRLPERLAGWSRTPVAAGDGSLRFRQQLESAGVEVLPDADPAHRMAARHICALAADDRARASDRRQTGLFEKTRRRGMA